MPGDVLERELRVDPDRAGQVRARVRLHAARRAAAHVPARARVRAAHGRCWRARRSAPSASSTSPTGSSSTARSCSARRWRCASRVSELRAAPARARVRLRHRGARRRRARVGGRRDEPQARRRATSRVRDEPAFEAPPVDGPVAAARRPRPPLRRRLGRPQPDPPARLGGEGVRLPARDRPRDVDEGALPRRAAAAGRVHGRRALQASRSCCPRR